jgi:peptidoglycan/xylan/chitin deacetylase (PgdA/CDA1 family)
MKNSWKRILSFLAAAAVMMAFTLTPVSADTVVGVGPDGSAGQQSQGAGSGPAAQNTAQSAAAQDPAGPAAEQSSAGAQTEASEGAAASYDNSFALSANYAMFFHNTGWGNWSPDNQRVYRTSTYPTAFKAVLAGAQPSSVSGTIQYQVNVSGTGWSAVAENGQPAGNEGGTTPLEAIRVWLNGDLAAGFDVYTMVMTGGHWGDWVINGQDAGETGTGKHIDGVRIAVVKKGAQPAEVPETTAAAAGVPVYSGGGSVDPSRPMIALTFDDGPAAPDNRILAALEAVGGRATFFMVGQNVKGHPDIIRRMVADGCELGNHSWSHPQLNKLSAGEVRSQINRTNDAIAAVAGHGATVMRCPYGATGGSVKSVLGDMGYASILWSIDTLDWKTRNASSTVSSVLDHVKDGDIILMHSLYNQTAAAVETMVPELVRRGYQLVTVSELAAARGGMKAGTNIGSFRK